MWKLPLVISALLPALVLANDDDAVCNGKDLASGDIAAGIEDIYCLIAVFESNQTRHGDIMTNCCLDSEPVQAPPMMDDRDMLCLQVCMVQNGEKQKSNETKIEALREFASCVKEYGDSAAYQPKNMICQNGPGPLPEGDDSSDGDGDNGSNNDSNNEDETETDSEDQEDSDQSTGNTEDEDDSGSGHATALGKGLRALGVSIAFWQVL